MGDSKTPPSDVGRRALLKLMAVSGGALAAAGTPLIAATASVRDLAVPPDHERRIRWWREAKFGMFVCCGPTSVAGRGDWVMGLEDISREDYEQMSQRFNPDPGAARAWARLARETGMKYMVFVAKHHDGYCLWDSKLTDFCATNIGPKRDIVREYVDAARAEGIRVGIYFSLLDWHHPDGIGCETDPRARERFVAFTHGQIRELLTNYGKIDILWYDVAAPLDASAWKSKEMNDLALSLQPDIIVNNRNWLPGDFSVSEQHTDGDDRDWESCMTLNDAWFYVPGDNNWKSAQQAVKSLVLCCRDGGNYLLNVGPRADGSIPEPNIEAFKRIGSWLKRNGSAVYGTERTRLRYSKIAGYTRKGNTAFMHVYYWPGTEIVVAGVAAKLRSAHFLADGVPIRFQQSGTKIVLRNLPVEAPDDVATVIALEFESEPVQDCLASRTAKRMYALADEIGFKW